MADNNYVEGNGDTLSQFRLPVNPYADPSNAIKMLGFGIDCCKYLASFAYEILAGGATTTITALTGNLDGDLRFYRVEVSDGAKTVTGSLSLAARTTPFVINTSTLNASAAWTIAFYGAEMEAFGDADCKLSYKVSLCCGAALAGASGDTIPASWVNVQLKMLLTSTSDANFDLFPVGGLIVNQGNTINLVDYLSAGTQLVNGGSYIFSIEMKKVGLDPSASAPTLPTNDVIASVVNSVTFPYAITTSYVEVNDTVTIETGTAGAFSELVTYDLANEGVTPSFSFTVATDVAV